MVFEPYRSCGPDDYLIPTSIIEAFMTTSKNGLDVNTIAQKLILLGVINAIKDIFNGSLKKLDVGLGIAGSAG